MAVLTEGKGDQQLGNPNVLSLPAGVDIVYKGSIVHVNAAGFAVPGSDTASEFYAGIALETVDNSGGSAGDKNVEVDASPGLIFRADAASMAQANVGDAVFTVDDQTVGVAATTTNDIRVGRIAKFVSATVVDVFSQPFDPST